jgi:uncharacterized DUF497 family protein
MYRLLNNIVILYVVTTDKSDGNTQIISASKATIKESEGYYEYYKKETQRN